MKKITLLIIFIVNSYLMIGQVQTTTKVENLGFVSELAYLKMNTEHFALRVINDTTITDKDKIRFANQYNIAKTMSDQLLFQLSADCKRKNSIKYYKRLDNIFVDNKFSEISNANSRHKKVEKYIDNLVMIRDYFEKLNSFESENKNNNELIETLSLKGFWPAVASVEELTGVLSFVSSSIKNNRERKENKVEKITEILMELRLTSVQELVKSKNDDKKEDD